MKKINFFISLKPKNPAIICKNFYMKIPNTNAQLGAVTMKIVK